MTSQEQAPYRHLSTPADDPTDRDIVIVSAEDSLVVDDLDDGLEAAELPGDGMAAADDMAADEDVAVTAQGDIALAYARHDNGDIGKDWHDIQAMFVDDPRGSVQLAAAAADAAVKALVATLHQRQAALTPAAGPGHGSGETEKLREALRSYRIFCQNVADLGQQLAEPVAMARPDHG